MEERELTALMTTPLEIEIITGLAERRTLSFRTPEGYFALTDAETNPEGDDSTYYDVNEAAYEDDSLSLYFSPDAQFQDEYDVVILNWPMNEKIIDFLAGHLFLGTPLRLALNTDGRNRMQ
ncbi:MAG: hypothetical protein GX776_02835 [Oxalobacter sp.]|nr:hypothetical protein [Oxalobacter sp.]